MDDLEVNKIIAIALRVASELSGRCASQVYINQQEKVFNEYKLLKENEKEITH